MLESRLLMVVLGGIGLMGMTISLLLGLRLRALRQQLRFLAVPAAADQTPATPPPAEGGTRFGAALMKAGLHDHLDRSCLQRPIPEKYRFITLLAENGLSSTQISAALKLGKEEVMQAMSLARLARRPGSTATVGRQPRQNAAKEKRAADRNDGHQFGPHPGKELP